MTRLKIILVAGVLSALALSCWRVEPALVARLRRATQALKTLDFGAQERVSIKLGEKEMTFESELYHRADKGTRRRHLGWDQLPPPPPPLAHKDPSRRERFGGHFGMGDEGKFADFLTASPPNVHLLCRNYNMALEGEDHIANRTCEKLALRGRRANRPAVLVWLDKETGLPLKRLDLNAMGETTAEREIIELRLGERGPDEWFQSPRHDREPRPVSIEEAARTLPGFVQPTTLPKGFELLGVSTFTRDEHTKVRLTYTDGLAKLVIYESRADEDEQRPRHEDGAGLVAQRRGFRDFTVLSARFGDIRVVVCSSLGEDELRSVLAGMSRDGH
ncbi:MAG: sigma-E factor regulatory protein RseB domain-containing protein [Planctomycetota bacterium]